MIINHTTNDSTNAIRVLDPKDIIFFIKAIQAFYYADPYINKNWHEDEKFEARVNQEGRIEAWVHVEKNKSKFSVFVG